MLKCQNVHIPKLWNKKLWEASNIPFLIFTIGFSNRTALYSWSVAGIPALLYKTQDELFCKNVRFQMERIWVKKYVNSSPEESSILSWCSPPLQQSPKMIHLQFVKELLMVKRGRPKKLSWVLGIFWQLFSHIYSRVLLCVLKSNWSSDQSCEPVDISANFVVTFLFKK